MTRLPHADRCTPCIPMWLLLPRAPLELPGGRVLPLAAAQQLLARAPAAARLAWGSGWQARGLARPQALAQGRAQVPVPAAAQWRWAGGRQLRPAACMPAGRPGAEARPAAALQRQ